MLSVLSKMYIVHSRTQSNSENRITYVAATLIPAQANKIYIFDAIVFDSSCTKYEYNFSVTFLLSVFYPDWCAFYPFVIFFEQQHHLFCCSFFVTTQKTKSMFEYVNFISKTNVLLYSGTLTQTTNIHLCCHINTCTTWFKLFWWLESGQILNAFLGVMSWSIFFPSFVSHNNTTCELNLSFFIRFYTKQFTISFTLQSFYSHSFA